MPAFTPGPWIVEQDFINGPRGSNVPDAPAFDGEWCSVAEVFGSDRKANARLIAAAPLMYQALLKVREWAAHADYVDPPVELAEALAAVEGRE